MIVKFNQTKRHPNPVFEVVLKDKIIINCVGSTRNDFAKFTQGEDTYEISDDVHRDKDKNGKTITQVKDILKNGDLVGRIYPDLAAQRKFWIFSFGYDYFVIDLYDKQYFAYEIGLGDNQHYICIYEQQNLMAVIHKDDKVINFKDTYTIYFEDEKLLTMLCIFNLYFDCVNHPDIGDTYYEKVESGSFVTVNKELNSKFDPAFIERIKQLENHKDN